MLRRVNRKQRDTKSNFKYFYERNFIKQRIHKKIQIYWLDRLNYKIIKTNKESILVFIKELHYRKR